MTQLLCAQVVCHSMHLNLPSQLGLVGRANERTERVGCKLSKKDSLVLLQDSIKNQITLLVRAGASQVPKIVKSVFKASGQPLTEENGSVLKIEKHRESFAWILTRFAQVGSLILARTLCSRAC